MNTYFIDIDGCILRHHNNMLSGQSKSPVLLENAIYLIDMINHLDGKIYLTTGRKESMKKDTENILRKFHIYYDKLIMGCTRGARILINDKKQNHITNTAFSFNIIRNELNRETIDVLINPCEIRPWGSYSCLAYTENYYIKEIIVNPKESTSLQSHKYRDEHWIIISGEGQYVNDSQTKYIKKNDYCHILKNTKHRIINNSLEKLILIEIQTGEKFLENDIARYDDQYKRC